MMNKENIIMLCKDTVLKVLDTAKDKEKAIKLEAELEREYLMLSDRLRRIGQSNDGSGETHDKALKAYEKKSQKLASLKESIADKDKRHFYAVQFADRLEEITDIKFSE